MRELRSDRGTDSIDAVRELREAMEELDNSHFKQFLSEEGCGFIVFKMNVPSTSHMGGI